VDVSCQFAVSFTEWHTTAAATAECRHCLVASVKQELQFSLAHGSIYQGVRDITPA